MRAAVGAALAERWSIPQAADRFAEVVAAGPRLAYTRDPFDRLIVAHATLLRARLATLDEAMHQHYALAPR